MIKKINTALLIAVAVCLMGSSAQRFFYGWAPNSTGQWVQDTVNGAGILFGIDGSGVSQNTVDGTDTKSLCLDGGGSCSNPSTRGGSLFVYGNENVSQTGSVVMEAGNISGGVVSVRVAGSGNAIFDRNFDMAMQNNTGAISFKSLSGGTAAGSTISDCTAVSRVITTVTSVGSGQGFCLDTPTNSGVMRVIQNRGANDLKLYPPAAAGAINGGTTGAAITLAAATKQIATCWHTGSGNWMVGVVNGP